MPTATRIGAGLGRALLGALVIFAAAPAHAQQFPSRPVRLVVPYPAGGANDIVARLLAPRMGEQLGQNVVVDNRGGGNTLIGSEIVAKAAPNGYTILIIAAGHAINPSLYPRLPYDTARDLTPIALIGMAPTYWWRTPRSRSRRLPTSSRSPKANRDKSLTPHRASAISRTLPGNCSMPWPASGCCTSPTRAGTRR